MSVELVVFLGICIAIAVLSIILSSWLILFREAQIKVHFPDLFETHISAFRHTMLKQPCWSIISIVWMKSIRMKDRFDTLFDAQISSGQLVWVVKILSICFDWLCPIPTIFSPTSWRIFVERRSHSLVLFLLLIFSIVMWSLWLPNCDDFVSSVLITICICVHRTVSASVAAFQLDAEDGARQVYHSRLLLLVLVILGGIASLFSLVLRPLLNLMWFDVVHLFTMAFAFLAVLAVLWWFVTKVRFKLFK